ncbi:hypothetical protein UFOVP2_15 [uncultured Caudovirales phage]|uniref:Uncharacterized protein n=1 Tax=uncultured Caudovirales phage TaxID=2100421 RepID=A0A6J5KJ26_9CAUD|nr:hypothetical protein UFOVP2_15 [uncultured Caudovirales phage]
MNCGKCHHFNAFSADRPEGSCIAHPPVASILMVPMEGGGFRPENFTAFPTLTAEQSCGEWTKGYPKLILS